MQSLFRSSLVSAVASAGEKQSGNDLFTSISPQPRNRWPAFVISAALHVLLGLVLPPLIYHLADESDYAAWIREERLIRTMRIRIPEELYVASSGSVSRPDRKTVSPQAAKALSSQTARSASQAKVRSRRGTPRRRFELPPLRHRLETAHTILQPQFAADKTPSAAVNLPEVFFWAPQMRQPQFVMPFRTPGYQDRPTQPRALNMPPKLEAPALEPPDMSTQAPLDLRNTPSPRLASGSARPLFR